MKMPGLSLRGFAVCCCCFIVREEAARRTGKEATSSRMLAQLFIGDGIFSAEPSNGGFFFRPLNERRGSIQCVILLSPDVSSSTSFPFLFFWVPSSPSTSSQLGFFSPALLPGPLQVSTPLYLHDLSYLCEPWGTQRDLLQATTYMFILMHINTR